MVSTYNLNPVFEVQQPSLKSFNNNELGKEKLTTSIKEAVSKVQNVATAQNEGETLLGNLPEVLQLCECLDQAFTHGYVLLVISNVMLTYCEMCKHHIYFQFKTNTIWLLALR